MFSRIKRRLQDVATIKVLCSKAEQHANAEGQQWPGAEHFVLAALELPDGTAAATFRRLHADPARFRLAIQQQYADALASIGVATAAAATPVPPAEGLYHGKASGQSLMLALAAQDKAGKPLLGAHVLIAAADAQQGVTARALRAMDITPAGLAEAARAELAPHA